MLVAMSRTPSVLVVDDHPALRAGLRGLLEQERGVNFAGAVASEAELLRALGEVRPDVVILDYALRRGDGLSACFRIKQRDDPPRVVLYTAYADDAFAVPAALAQADAVVSKADPVQLLLGTIRDVAAGRLFAPRPDPEFLQTASARLEDDDLPVVGMLFARVPVEEIAETLDVTPAEVRARALRVIGEMQAVDRRRPLAKAGEVERVPG